MSVPTLELPEPLARQIREEGAAAYPNECCGILFGRDVAAGGVTRRVLEAIDPVPNEFEESEQYHRFRIEKALLAAEKSCTGGRLVLGFYHSHPDHPARPSEYDREHAWPFYSYVIVAVDKRQPGDMTSWVLSEQTKQFEAQAIETR